MGYDTVVRFTVRCTQLCSSKMLIPTFKKNLKSGLCVTGETISDIAWTNVTSTVCMMAIMKATIMDYTFLPISAESVSEKIHLHSWWESRLFIPVLVSNEQQNTTQKNLYTVHIQNENSTNVQYRLYMHML